MEKQTKQEQEESRFEYINSDWIKVEATARIMNENEFFNYISRDYKGEEKYGKNLGNIR